MSRDLFKQRAEKEAKKAIEAYRNLKEVELKEIEDEETATKVIEKFTRDLGFGVYCEEFMVSFISYCTHVCNESEKDAEDVEKLMVLVLIDYVEVHKGALTKEFVALVSLIIKACKKKMMVRIVKRVLESDSVGEILDIVLKSKDGNDGEN